MSNVKVGDLAIMVHSFAGNEGAIVKVLSPLGEAPVNYKGKEWFDPGEGFLWLVEFCRPAKSTHYDNWIVCPARDFALRPVSGIPDEQTEEEDNKLEA